MDAATGAHVWDYMHENGEGGPIATSPVIHNGLLYIANTQGILALRTVSYTM